jgi:GTP cyclohydrolase I
MKIETKSDLIVCNGNLPLTDAEKQKMIEEAAYHYGQFLTSLKFDWENDVNASDTPRRVAKSFVNDLIAGCYANTPKITTFANTGEQAYDGMVFEGNIDLKSMCAHHHLSFMGKAHIAYIPAPNSEIVGLSKLNRIVEHFARRPQIQENLTMQIHDFINKTCKGNLGVAVMLEANHLCACVRGVKHNATMVTSKLSGVFMDNGNLARGEFYEFVKRMK